MSFLPNLTIRDIPVDVLNKLRFLSKTERRSLNSEVLILLEFGLKNYICEKLTQNRTIISKETQLKLWSDLFGKWEDERETKEIIKEIYEKRTKGRDVEL